MLYPKDIEQKLGFDKIKKSILSKCSSSLGENMLNKVRFSSDYDVINKLLNQTGEFINILNSGDSFSVGSFIDVQDALKKSATEGAFLTEMELVSISKYIDTYDNCISYLTKNPQQYPYLNSLGKDLSAPTEISRVITNKIDKDGKVKDNASKELLDIRTSLRTKYNQVRKTLQSIYKQSVSDGFVPEGATITVREGRMVIPIMAEYKRRLPGFIHDESASGSTVFLEPTHVLEGNNEIRELEYSEKREIAKILTDLTNQVRAALPSLEAGQRYLAKLDFIRAKARYSQEIVAVIPQIYNKPMLAWSKAKHPVLEDALAKEGKKIVPLDINLNEEQRLLIISGPNAGGKSVSLKTVGLLQYMLQCGMPIPVDESTEAGIYKNIFIDIGDEQSLENDLSTYSSHLRSMKYFLEHCDNQSLCLIDEFGTGTDPQFGGAIAESVLKELNQKKAYGVITTHYGNIKSYSENTKGIVNGAMRFDMSKLEPLFELEIGKPGSSFSLEIARKTGLSESLLTYAKEQIGSKNINVDELLNQLEKQKQQVKSRDIALKNRENKVKQLEQKYESLRDEIETNKKQIIDKAKAEAAQILKNTNKEIEKTIRHIKTNNAQKSETKKARERLNTIKDEIAEKREKSRIVALENDASKLDIGDIVKLIDQEVTGTVLSEKGNDIEVQIGLLKTKIKRNRLEKISKGKQKQVAKGITKNSNLDLTSKLAQFSTTLNVRGKRAEEVIPELERFLDEALLFGINEVKILHGKGNGILREIVRNYAKSQHYIKSARDEDIDKGGAGITVIDIN